MMDSDKVAGEATPPILRLPIDVIVKIASYLSISDLSALRLTCRAVDDLLIEFYHRKVFRAKQFWMDEASLQALIDMSTHPTISRELKHVTLGSEHIYLEQENPPYTSAQIQQLHLRLASQRYMQHTGTDIAMLAKAFARLPNLQTLTIRDVDNCTKSTEYMKSTTYTIGGMFRKLLVALAHAIEVIVEDQRCAPCDRDFYIPAALQSSFKPTLSKLTKLHLALYIEKGLPGLITLMEFKRGREAPATNFSPLLLKFISLTPRITSLRLCLS